ncbi:MAG: HAMP domain-containing protein [Oceanospirillaceae bacterium]|jgi:signal transduction histidine kinase|nr:HAMP domain-containing protein [Oceanospirillaceae bacterium]MBT4441829.1 HAMP domain-containing protein [Oceanospirillaceae bacterium]MBT6076949.1 HAMP domain-containing protein [Oceanospirillaceae bacterium]
MARVTLVLFVGILIAQVFGTWLWISQLKASEHNRLIEVSQTMGSRIGQTVQFFKKLPDQYRHIVLDQLRDMGGTRFFVSVNEQHIALQTIPQTEFSQLVREQMSSSIVAQMGQARGLDIQFVDFDDLKILSGSNLMVDLPPKWKRFALMEPSDSSPVAVVQLPVANEWIYLAAVIPEGHMLNGVTWLNTERLLSIGLVSLTVLLLTLLLVRWVVRPLRLLARQAEAIGKGRNPRHMREQGSSEMIATIRAFNAMVGRIQKFMGDRERLFAAISHDLKTPLTRARLRAEMISDTDQKEALIGDLENLETMVKGSLQMMKDDAIHENTQRIDLSQLLLDLASKNQIYGLPIELDIQPGLAVDGRNMALQRMFSNLMDNALTYGRAVTVVAKGNPQGMVIRIMDPGPGLNDADKARVFEPYYRLTQKPSGDHVGLGLGIARSIANLHGGELELKDRAGGGLMVEVYFPS